MQETNTIGDYEIIELLGEGAAGAAYHARHRETGDDVAIKLLHAQANDDIDLQNRFVREVSVLERLDHPNIVRHRDCGIHEGKLFLAMELVESGTLSDVLKKRGALPWRVAAGAASQICAALDHAHRQGVIHRDLKPANLFLSADGKVKVGDFGLARDLMQHRLTADGQTVGTCKYMAPEQVKGQAELSGALDLYALGCLLFEMLAGRAPFDGATFREVFEKHLFSEPPDVLTLAPQTSPELSAVVRRLLAKKPEDRPTDAEAARRMLDAVLNGEPLPEDSTPTNLAEQLRTPVAQETKKPNLAAAAVLLAVAAAIGAAIWFAASGG